MMKKFGPVILILLISFSAKAQSDNNPVPSTQQPEKRYGRPDIPGTFSLELGLNVPISAPDKFDAGYFGSRTFNVYYNYDFRLFKSRFSFTPGIGLSLERYKFKNDYTLGYVAGPQGDTLKMISPTEAGFSNVRKSQLIMNYLEVPIEIKYSSKPDDPNRSFKASLGFRVGVLYDSFTKIKYREDGETKKLKDKQNFNLTQFRYGVFAKVGFGNFNIFTYYNLTPVFEKGNGLYENNRHVDFNTLTFGISLSSF